ncbi:glycosyltransferase family 2 protein [Kaistella anthropi]|nr:glycosyltransferase family 2 protein [Kaistella anthropi]
MISVIVPVYNVEKYLSGCLQSICSQTYDNIEILLIDDGSTDSSWEICNRFAAADSRIIILQKENGGQSSARNLGLDMATGDYIAFIDSDDAISADVLEKAMSQFEKYPHVEAVQFPVFMEYGTAGQYLNVKKNSSLRVLQTCSVNGSKRKCLMDCL